MYNICAKHSAIVTPTANGNVYILAWINAITKNWAPSLMKDAKDIKFHGSLVWGAAIVNNTTNRHTPIHIITDITAHMNPPTHKTVVLIFCIHPTHNCHNSAEGPSYMNLPTFHLYVSPSHFTTFALAILNSTDEKRSCIVLTSGYTFVGLYQWRPLKEPYSTCSWKTGGILMILFADLMNLQHTKPIWQLPKKPSFGISGQAPYQITHGTQSKETNT